MLICCGVDPGVKGGLAIVRSDDSIDQLADAIDIPTIGSGAKERVDVAAIRGFIEHHKPTMAVIERSQAMPRQGASSGFKYGRAVGALEAAIVLCNVPMEIIEPTAWKRFWRLPAKDKERSRQKALELFPSAHGLMAFKKDHGKSEAALLALYTIRQRQATTIVPGLRNKSHAESRERDEP